MNIPRNSIRRQWTAAEIKQLHRSRQLGTPWSEIARRYGVTPTQARAAAGVFQKSGAARPPSEPEQ